MIEVRPLNKESIVDGQMLEFMNHAFGRNENDKWVNLENLRGAVQCLKKELIESHDEKAYNEYQVRKTKIIKLINQVFGALEEK